MAEMDKDKKEIHPQCASWREYIGENLVEIHWSCESPVTREDINRLEAWLKKPHTNGTDTKPSRG